MRFFRQGALIITLLFSVTLYAQDNNDCVNAIPICSDENINLNPTGPGNNDFSDPDNFSGCLSSGEHQSGWYYFEIQGDAPPNLNLGFIIDPDAGGSQDYDFAVYGPDVPCDDLGNPIRCSYAAGGCAFCPQTGLGMGATDVSESPFGNGFVAELIVQPGQGYYLLVDNFSNNSTGFSLSWTGAGAPWLNCILCDADAGTLTATPNPACPGETINFNTTDFYDDPAYTQVMMVADANGDILEIIPGSSGSFSSAVCADFIVYSYNYETAGGAVVPTVGMNAGDIDCSLECCDLEELPISFADDEQPTFPTAPADLTLTCADQITPMEDLEWADNCDGTGLVAGTETGSADACPGGQIVRTWEYTDVCGNTGTHVQTITVEPTPEATFLSAPADMTVSCANAPSGGGGGLNYSNGQSGACLIADVVFPTETGSYDLCGGQIIYTWEVTDPCGRQLQHIQTITVEPAPEANFTNPPADLTVDCNNIPSGPGPDLDYTNGETGDCEISGSLPPVVSGSADLCGGQITYTWDVTDDCGRPISHTQTITVEPAPEASYQSPPTDITISCADIPTAPPGDLFYTNGASGDCEISGFTPVMITGSADRCGGQIVYTWDTTDPCGRPITHTQTITVEPAAEAAFLAPPAGFNISCTDLDGLSAPDLDYTNGESGNCIIEGTVVPVQSGSADACGGTIVFTWSFTDDCGRPLNHTQTITVEPAPEASFESLPADETVACADAPFGDVPDLIYSNGETGSCAIAGALPGTRSGVADQCGGTVVFTWAFTDGCGRTISHDQTFTVEPAQQAAFINPPGDQTFTCDNIPTDGPPDLDYTNEEFGTCAIEGSIPPVQDGFFDVCGGTVTYTYAFTDDCGRTINHVQNVTVLPGPTPEFIDPPADVTVTCDNLPDDAALELGYDNGFTGACEIFGTVQPAVSGFAGVCGGELTYTWAYTDPCGRPITHVQVITVEPGPPTAFVDPPTDLTISCADYAAAPAPDLTYDNGVVGDCELFGFVSPSTFGTVDECGGTITHLWSFTDACGRSISHSQNITVEPAADPEFIDPPVDGSLACGEDFPEPGDLFYTNGATEDCALDGSVVAVVTPITTDQQRYDWTYTTPCTGTTITHTQTLTRTSAPQLEADVSAVDRCAGEPFDLATVVVTDTTGGNPTLSYHSGTPAGDGNLLTGTTVTPNDTTTYYILGTNADGCGDEIPVTVNVDAPPNAGEDATATICAELSAAVNLAALLSGDARAGGTWTDPDGTGVSLTDPSAVNLSAVTAGSYRFEYTVASPGPCPGDTATVTLELQPPITLSVSNVLCTDDLNGYGFSIDAGGFAVTTTGGGTLTDLGNGQYELTGIPIGNTVEITANNPIDPGCTVMTSVSPPDCNCPNVPAPESEGSPVICQGEPTPALTVTLADGQTANWYDAATGGALLLGASTTYTPAETTPGTYTYYVEAENTVDGCVSAVRTPVSLDIVANPVGNNAALVTCDEDFDGRAAFDLTAANADITGQPGISFRYFPLVGGNPDFSQPLPSDYTNGEAFAEVIAVELTNAAGCTALVELTLTVNVPPNVNLMVTPETCAGAGDGTVTLTAVDDATLAVTSENGDVAFGQTELAPGNYLVTATSADGCVAATPFTIAPGNTLAFSTFTAVCDNNGTPSDETDDFYLITYVVDNSLGQSGTYTLSDGTEEWGSFAYGTTQTRTVAAAGQAFALTATDDVAGCTITQPVGPLTSCSSDCLISVDELNWVCDDNGTETDPEDDFYVVSLSATAVNGSAAGTYAVLLDEVLVGVLAYGESIAFNVPADGSSPVVTARDTDEAFCRADQPIGPLFSCSGTCTLAQSILAVRCDDAGTPTDPTDDTWSFDLVVTGANVGQEWEIAALDLTGGYGDTVTVGPFPVADGDRTFTLADRENPACPLPFTAPAPAPCSDDCTLELTELTYECDDNGTISEPADDFYRVRVNAAVTNAPLADSFLLFLNDQLFATYAYAGGADFTLPAGGTPTIRVENPGNPSCSVSETLPVLTACDVLCSLSAEVVAVICNEPGTSDEGDDLFTFDLLVTGEDVSTAWTTDNEDGPFPYGAARTFGPYPITDGTRTLTVRDVVNPGCPQTIVIDPPAPCSLPCEITASFADVTCDDAGTGNTATDDTYTFVVTVTGENTSGQWRTADGLLSGNYGQPVTVEALLIADGPAVLLIEDAENPGCQTTLTVAPPAACSACTQTINAGPDETLTCTDPSTFLEATSSHGGDFGWWFDGILIANQIGATVTEPGVYRFTATFPDGCFAEDSLRVNEATDQPRITQVEVVHERCSGEENGRIVLEDVNGGEPPYSYLVNGESISSAGFFTRLVPGDYAINVTDANGCRYDTLITIEPGPKLTISDELFVELSRGDSTMVNVEVTGAPGNELSVQWSPPDQLSCDTCLTTQVNAGQSVTYLIDVVHVNGCAVSTSLQLLAPETLDIYVPTAFSPNGDGSNDFFTLFAEERVVNVAEFALFDRWGEQVFFTKDIPTGVPELGWDGRLNGQPMNPAVFVYSFTLELDTGEMIVVKGDVTLMR